MAPCGQRRQRRRAARCTAKPGLSRLVLASASPRRQTLIELLGLAWRAAPTDLDEERYLLGDATLSALNVALAKARATLAAEDEVVLAADTIVALDGQALGKPSDAADATRMLRSLRGRAHEVLTGVVVRAAVGREWSAVVATRVVMRGYSDDEIAAYVARGEPFDKAGGYAVQDAAFAPVERCEGCYLNVVGLPLCAAAAGLAALEVAEPRLERHRPPCTYCAQGAPLVSIRSGY